MSGKKNKTTRAKTARHKKNSRSGKKRNTNNTDISASDSRSTLQRAEKLYKKNKLDETIDIIRRILPEMTNADDSLKCYRLLAFALANGRKFAGAEEAALKGLAIDNDDPDCHFALAFIFANYKDYDKCRYHSEIFLDKTATREQGKGQEPHLSDGHLNLLYNYLGLSYQAQNEYEKAVESFRKAIELDESYNHPYLNLAVLYQRRKECEKAEEIVRLGLEKCSQVQELRILEKSLASKATVSACMMVKNEEEFLEGCLQSIRNWVDEIIVVDTGSTDRTMDIARSYGARVFSQEWSKDFSRHRNYSISKASSDWVFIIDADEEFVEDDLSAVRQAMNQDKFRIVSLTVMNMNKKNGECTSFLPSPRLFRRIPEFYYKGIVHNQLQFPEDEPILRIGARIKHYGYNLPEDKNREKAARSRELLEKQLEQTPDDPFVNFNYAQLLRGINGKNDFELSDLILKHAARAVELSDPSNRATLPLYLQGLHQQATTLIKLNKYDEAVEKCRQALKSKPDYLDALFTIGEAYGRMQDFDKAVKYFNEYLTEQKKYDPAVEELSIILIYGFMRHRAHYSLGLIHQIQGNIAQAEKYYKKALADQDPCLDTYLKLAGIYLDREDPEKALEYIEKELSLNPSSDLANLYKARYHDLVGNSVEADRFMDRAVELTDDKAEIYERAGVHWAARGELSKAIRLMELLVRVKPDYPHGFMLLAQTYYNQGDFPSAIPVYKKYLQLSPEDAAACNDLAGCHFKLGEYEKAEKLYTRALQLNKTLAPAYRNLGLTRLHMNKPNEALPLLEDYVNSAPEDVEISLAVGDIYKQLKRFAEALPYFENYLKARPNHIEALFNISECYYYLGYTDSAMIGYLQILKVNPGFQPARARLAEMDSTKTPA